jgi:lipid-A-disaccharide synthase-like uncharacterized protein
MLLIPGVVTAGGGSSSAELSSFLVAFARQLLGPSHRWASTAWDIMEAVPLPAAAVGEAWQLLLAAAVHLEGAAFMQGRWDSVQNNSGSVLPCVFWLSGCVTGCVCVLLPAADSVSDE